MLFPCFFFSADASECFLTVEIFPFGVLFSLFFSIDVFLVEADSGLFLEDVFDRVLGAFFAELGPLGAGSFLVSEPVLERFGALEGAEVPFFFGIAAVALAGAPFITGRADAGDTTGGAGLEEGEVVPFLTEVATAGVGVAFTPFFPAATTLVAGFGSTAAVPSDGAAAGVGTGGGVTADTFAAAFFPRFCSTTPAAMAVAMASR